jgi:hypothetical protein
MHFAHRPVGGAGYRGPPAVNGATRFRV